jgi:hypothetical protein
MARIAVHDCADSRSKRGEAEISGTGAQGWRATMNSVQWRMFERNMH